MLTYRDLLEVHFHQNFMKHMEDLVVEAEEMGSTTWA